MTLIIMMSMRVTMKNEREGRLTLTTTFTFSPPWLSSILQPPTALINTWSGNFFDSERNSNA